MRLTPEEVEAIKDCARAHFGEGAVVRLFGSRARDDLRGGDIDLHVVAESDERATYSQESRFKEALEGRIGEQRIDVIVRAPQDSFDAIDNVAALTGVVLEEGWPELRREPTMSLDEAQLKIMSDAVKSGRRTSSRLDRTLSRLEPQLPFTSDVLADLDEAESQTVDSLLLQFMNMVSILQGQLVRSIVRASGQDVGRMTPIDLVNAAEKLDAWPEGVAFKAIVDARNSLAHQYPHDPVRQVVLVNKVAAAAPMAISAFRGLEQYVERKHPEAVRD